MIDANIRNCTRCGREFTDLRVEVGLGIYVSRLKESDVWEGIANLDQTSTEVLCPSCFDEFAQVLGQLNIPYSTAPNPAENKTSSCECGSSALEPAVEEDCAYAEPSAPTN